MTIKVQIDDLVRDATPDELAIIEAQHADELTRVAAVEAAAAAKESAKAKFAALGLTEAEITALVG